MHLTLFTNSIKEFLFPVEERKYVDNFHYVCIMDYHLLGTNETSADRIQNISYFHNVFIYQDVVIGPLFQFRFQCYLIMSMNVVSM